MKVIRTFVSDCICCMEKHSIKVVSVDEVSTYKNVKVPYRAEYNYCENAGEYYATEEQLKKNSEALKAAYRELVADQV